MIEDHATVRDGSYIIPLIGVPPSATEEQCEVCKKNFHVAEVTLDADGKMKCKEHIGK